jgi:hypothetical protein
VAGILLQPRAEWARVADEFTTVSALYRSYILPLALIPALARAGGHALWGIPTLFGGTIHVSLVSAAQGALIYYALIAVAVFLTATVIDALAATFDGKRNRVQAAKVAAYAATAVLLSGVFVLVPGGQWLRLTGLYSLYLLYTGVGSLMKAPRDRAMGYAVIAGVAGVVVFLIVDAVSSAFLPGR